MKIIKLSASNFMRLKAVSIVPDGPVVRITGKNSHGKTSVLDAIWSAIGGEKFAPEKPIHEGEDRAAITVDLGEYVVTRSFTEKSTELVVRSKDGTKVTSPQTLLNSWLGKITFDPFEFSRSKPQDQIKILAGIAEIDFDDLNRRRQEAYSKRTEVNRQYATSAAASDALYKQVEGLSPKDFASPLDPIAVTEKWKDARNAHEKHRQHQERLKAQNARITAKETELESLRQKVVEIEIEIRDLEERFTVEASHVDSVELPNLDEIERELHGVTDHNAKVETFTRLRKALDDGATIKRLSDELTHTIEQIDQQKADAIAAADLPIKGLTFDDNGVFLNGIPFSQAADSEKLRVGLALAMKLNPTLRVARITDGSLLDKASMEIIEESAAKEDFQVWIEVVADEPGGPGIYIEDGEVR